MTTRPTHKNRNSAIYLGKDPLQLVSTPPGIPDLPEPPSPVSSNGSGLPSPPATNSTGSGSTGDPASIALRQKHPMLNESNVKAFHAAFSTRSQHNDDDDDYENDHDNTHDNGEDDTARLDRRLSSRSNNENMQALERVRSLTQRNRLALDKLSSFRGSPSPSLWSTSDPRTPPESSASSSSSSRPISHRPPRHSYDHLSGSETERESLHPNHTSTSSNSSSSQSSTHPNRPTTPVASSSTSSSRVRLKSAPTSPNKALLRHSSAASTSTGSSGSPSRRRNRVSMAISDTSQFRSDYGDDESDVTRSALAAVASSRRSPTVNKRRHPLPREFLDSSDRRGSLDAGPSSSRNGRLSVEPPKHQRSATLQLSPRHSQLASTGTPSVGRSTTLRRNQTRWLSEDFTSPPREPTSDDEDLNGRRQTLRGGSAESALTAGRSLVGEGLRAAGIGRKSTGPGDIFDSGGTRRSIVRSPDYEGERRRSRSRLEGSRAGTMGATRAATSMADYRVERENYDEPMTPALRSHKSAYPFAERDRPVSRAGAGSSLARHSSPFGTTRRQQQQMPPSAFGAGEEQEHMKLMMEGLSMFEANLSRIPHLAASSSDLIKNAAGLVNNADRLNELLRAGTSRALEEQIKVEVDAGNEEIAEVWRKMGGDYRDGVRINDELIRCLTLFLLGVGRVVRDNIGHSESHARSVSLDEAQIMDRRSKGSLSPDTGENGSGRRSAESRKSWEFLNVREREREDTLRRLSAGRPESSLGGGSGGSGGRPSSALNLRRDRDSGLRYETPPPRDSGTSGRKSTNALGVGPSSSMRRLYTPREQRDREGLPDATPLASVDSQATLQGYEPSPTPASRSQPRPTQSNDRSRTFTPLDIPKPIPSLPSEQRRPQPSREQRKASIPTIRGPNFPSITIPAPNATTALTTHTVTHSPVAFPISRTNSSKTNSSGKGPTFSRSSTVSITTLSGLQMADRRKRTTSANSDTNEATTTPSPRHLHHQSEPEPEIRRDRRGTLDRSVRISLDGNVHPADRSAAAAMLPPTNTASRTRERRRTVTDIWPPGGGHS